MDLSWSLQNMDLSASFRAAEWAAARAAQTQARAFAPQVRGPPCGLQSGLFKKKTTLLSLLQKLVIERIR